MYLCLKNVSVFSLCYSLPISSFSLCRRLPLSQFIHQQTYDRPQVNKLQVLFPQIYNLLGESLIPSGQDSDRLNLLQTFIPPLITCVQQNGILRVHIGTHVNKDREINGQESSIRQTYYARTSLCMFMMETLDEISYGHR